MPILVCCWLGNCFLFRLVCWLPILSVFLKNWENKKMCYGGASLSCGVEGEFSYLMRKYGLKKCLVIWWFMKSVFSMVIENVALFIISLRSLFDVFVIELSLIFHVVLICSSVVSTILARYQDDFLFCVCYLFLLPVMYTVWWFSHQFFS